MTEQSRATAVTALALTLLNDDACAALPGAVGGEAAAAGGGRAAAGAGVAGEESSAETVSEGMSARDAWVLPRVEGKGWCAGEGREGGGGRGDNKGWVRDKVEQQGVGAGRQPLRDFHERVGAEGDLAGLVAGQPLRTFIGVLAPKVILQGWYVGMKLDPHA
ncbi:unnamed protein product [Closterium sp. Naga37s-1]|nr:unnamed protein product [Closterium sp. Naga37s-1]